VKPSGGNCDNIAQVARNPIVAECDKRSVSSKDQAEIAGGDSDYIGQDRAAGSNKAVGAEFIRCLCANSLAMMVGTPSDNGAIAAERETMEIACGDRNGAGQRCPRDTYNAG
jgi:hypothetical protein